MTPVGFSDPTMTTDTVLGTLLRLGDDFGGSSGGQYLGLLDEVRIGTVANSANYIATDYALQSSTTMVTAGTPEDSTAQAYTMSLLRIPCQLRTMLLSVLVLNTLVRLTRSR